MTRPLSELTHHELARRLHAESWKGSDALQQLVLEACFRLESAPMELRDGDERWYVSGPMTGLPEFNVPAFRAATTALRAAGYDVVCPTELCPEPGLSWQEYLRRDLAGMLACSGVAVLPGWEASRGAALEVHVARALGMPVVDAAELAASEARALRDGTAS